MAEGSNGFGPEPWLDKHVDFGRDFLAGESAGANIAQYVAVKAGVNGLEDLKITGLFTVHPFFGDEVESNMYKYLCPTSSGSSDDAKLVPNLLKLGCDKSDATKVPHLKLRC
ncbi:hypothetical protein JCGZ_20434 [Jatropha curcas]|uniref:Alpha/beta hydrolase fold-3 domain-containing protein n=1 Tax=Jatropha curcas TaxID=180498 RepID=A0A067JR55_JATCU|nr:hypothetical protein JCGZ_20434 [Jatropha curcas]